MQTAVVIMSKIPQPGFSKTRLNTVLSEQDSAGFHRACLLDTCRAVMNSRLRGYIYYLPADSNISAAGKETSAVNLMDLPLKEANYFELYPQQGDDLGARLYLAGRNILNTYEAVILLGSDAPGISAQLILETQVRLSSHDIVIGPARDGGYYLLAIKKDCPGLFNDIPWGTEQVFEKTMAAVRRQQLSWSLLQFQRDIDSWQDLLDFYYEGQVESKCYRDLTAYKMAGRLIEKYGAQRERKRRIE